MVRYSKRRSRNRKRHHGGSGLSSLNPTPVDFTTNKSLTEIQRIPLVDPSPILARSQPFIPPRPGAPSPPPPLHHHPRGFDSSTSVPSLLLHYLRFHHHSASPSSPCRTP